MHNFISSVLIILNKVKAFFVKNLFISEPLFLQAKLFKSYFKFPWLLFILVYYIHIFLLLFSK